MAKLIKQYENGTDFTVCVWESKKGDFPVTTFDTVSRKHFDVDRFTNQDDAIKAARKRNNAYKI